jgi:hypothetical protein
MVKTTRKQREALKKVFDRGPCYRSGAYDHGFSVTCNIQYARHYRPLTYRQFRRFVRPGYDCIMLHWCGMWLGIEPDGYTHS